MTTTSQKPRSRAGKITRRGFLVAGIALAGGAGFVAWKASQPLPNPLAPAPGDTSLNPWLILTADGPVIVVPRAEMGQGVQGTLAAMVAEELDVAWETVRVIHGPAAAAYYTGGIIAAALPYRHYDQHERIDRIAGALDFVPRLMGMQVTGGSTSATDAFDKMRLAGATAREALKSAAAARLGINIADLRTEDGHVITPDGARIPYADLAADAVAAPLPEVTLRPRSAWRLLGQSLPRPDMLAKVTGKAEFGADIRLPGMKFAALRRNPHLGGAMVSYDSTPAMAIDGVERVIDLGDGVAVVASNSWAAMQGADAVVVDWAASPIPASHDALIAQIASAFDGSRNSRLRNEGAADTPADAPLIEVEYSVPYLAHATMEPMNATALVTAEGLTLWGGFQAPGMAGAAAAKAVGIGGDDVTVNTTFLGGGFGRRAETDFATFAARVAATMPDTPVQLMWSREEDMTHDMYRPAAIARARAQVIDGRAHLFDMKIAAPSVTRDTARRMMGMAPPGPDRALVEGACDQPYAIPNYRVEGYISNARVPVGAWRSVGNSYGSFFHESLIDEMAHAAGVDPLSFRLDLVRPEHPASAKVLEAVAEMADWGAPTPPDTGRGVAFCYSFGTPVAQIIEVRRSADGIALERAWIACDPGIALDPGNIEAQMVSGLIMGLSAAIGGEITFEQGAAQQHNFTDYESLRMHTAPRTEVRILENNPTMGGIGEPGTPPAAPALANALFSLTGTRARSLPLHRQFDFIW